MPIARLRLAICLTAVVVAAAMATVGADDGQTTSADQLELGSIVDTSSTAVSGYSTSDGIWAGSGNNRLKFHGCKFRILN
eukprot:SAG31_NODE_15135_length_768_cov_1.820628_1_plen_80_part_00